MGILNKIKMNYIVRIFLCLLNLVAFSQEKKILQVEYDIFYNTDVPNTRKGVLQVYLKENKSVFFEKEHSLGTKTENEGLDINFTYGVNETPFVKMWGDNSTILYNDFWQKQTYLITDSINCNWNISYSETKKIGNSLCNKATMTFRGRNYTAWYDANYPVHFGPWKFRGLPGLVMEIYDEEKRYNWLATRISYTDSFKDNFIEHRKKLTFREYKELRLERIYNVDNSRLPRGTRVEINYSKNKELERVFEWEE